MTDPITQARQIVSGMTPGPWVFDEPWTDEYNIQRATLGHGGPIGARFNEEAIGELYCLNIAPDEFRANAAGIILATNLLRTLTSEGAEEALKAHIEKELGVGSPRIWAGTLARAVISHLLAQAIGGQP